MPVAYKISPTGKITGVGPRPLRGIPAVVTFSSNGATIGSSQIVPLQAVAAQVLTITLNQQACAINVYVKELQVPDSPPGSIPTDPPIFTKMAPMFLDLYVNDALVVGGVLCLDRTLIVRNPYFGFVGDLAFVDTTGGDDPAVDGLGNRFLLTYWPQLP